MLPLLCLLRTLNNQHKKKFDNCVQVNIKTDNHIIVMELHTGSNREHEDTEKL